LAWIARKCALEYTAQTFWRSGWPLLRKARAHCDRPDERDRIVGGKERLAKQHFYDHCAQSVNIGALCCRLAGDSLWSTVAERPDETFVPAAREGGRFGTIYQAEVGEKGYATVVEQDVGV